MLQVGVEAHGLEVDGSVLLLERIEALLRGVERAEVVDVERDVGVLGVAQREELEAVARHVGHQPACCEALLGVAGIEAGKEALDLGRVRAGLGDGGADGGVRRIRGSHRRSVMRRAAAGEGEHQERRDECEPGDAGE
ncbi:MAG: hypothetical protein EBU31_16650, partial [Proteobacteria bacterium]|nr:hypothetical protein [Pseudomonadota bacterium]